MFRSKKTRKVETISRELLVKLVEADLIDLGEVSSPAEARLAVIEALGLLVNESSDLVHLASIDYKRRMAA